MTSWAFTMRKLCLYVGLLSACISGGFSLSYGLGSLALHFGWVHL